MKQNVPLKSTLRQPVRTLLLLLLVGLISFAFIARAVEYLVVRQEIERLGGYYRAIGSLVPDDPEARAMPPEAVELLANSKYIDFEDYRRECSGVMDGILNTDLSGQTSDHSWDLVWVKTALGIGFGNLAPQTAGVHVSDMLVYATFKEASPGPVKNTCILHFTVDMVEAGYPEFVQPGEPFQVTYSPKNAPLPDIETARLGNYRTEDADAFTSGMIVGERYLIKACYNPGIMPVFDMSTPLSGLRRRLTMLPLSSDGLWYLAVPPGETADFDDPRLAELKAELEVLKINQSAMHVYSTKDMSAMPVTQESARRFYLTDGRWLNRDDDLNGNRVCVVNSVFAELRGLRVGDTIPLTLRDMQSGMLGYIRDEMGDSWRDLPTQTEELEIVGLYSDLNVKPADYNPASDIDADYTLYLYLPDSVMPAGFDAGATPRVEKHIIPYTPFDFDYSRFESDDPADWTTEGLPEPDPPLGFFINANMDAPTYSFVLKSARDEDAFLAENQDALAALGLNISFAPNNAGSFWASAEPLLRSTATNAAVFALLLLLALALAVFLYHGQRRREFAIQRTLGVPANRAVLQLIFPLALLGFIGIIAGGMISWNYALEKARETLAAIITNEGDVIAAPLSQGWLVGFVAVIFVLLLLFAGVGAATVSRRPILALLQGAAVRKQREFITTPPPVGAPLQRGEAGVAAMRTWASMPLQTGAKSPLFAPQARFVWRQMVRTPLKSLLSIAVALAFLLAIGWMTHTITFSEGEIERLYGSIVVTADILQSASTGLMTDEGFIRPRTVDAVLNSGLVQSVCLEANSTWDSLAAPGTPALSIDSVWGGGSRAQSFGAYGLNSVDDFLAGTWAGISIAYAEGYDKDMFAADWGNWDDIVPVILRDTVLKRLGLGFGDVILRGKINDSGATTTSKCTIAGSFSGISDEVGPDILLPMSAMARIEQSNLRYSAARFVFEPTMNRELMESRAALQAIVEAPGAGEVSLRLMLWDKELQQVIGPMEKNVALLTILYPITLAVSALISAGLALLLVLQSAKDAAILRVLGTTKRKTRAALLVQQGALCLLGLLLGGSGAWLLFHVLDLPAAALYLAACLAAALFAATLVTRKKPLELLQVKE